MARSIGASPYLIVMPGLDPGTSFRETMDCALDVWLGPNVRGANSLIRVREQGGVAARGRGVDRQNLLGAEAGQIAGATGLRAGSGKAAAAERLGPDDG